MNVADQLEDVTVLDTRGESLTLGSLWREAPHVLVFVRHYG